jgi:hypothetical protein
MRQKADNEQGYIVLITVIILGIVATTIATFILLTGTNTSLSSAAVSASTSAKAGASGCAQLALSAIKSNPSAPDPLTSSSTLDTTINETCSYSITGSAPDYTIVSLGTVTQKNNTYTHGLTIETNQVSPTIQISSWQDTPGN